MSERTTRSLLVAVVLLLIGQSLRPAPTPSTVEADEIPAVLRAHAIELVDRQGRVVAQLHVGDDGGGNLRLRSGDGTIRVKLGATADGSGLLLTDKASEPALRLDVNERGTSLTLAEKGKETRILTP